MVYVDYFLLIVLLLSLYTDFRYQKIYNGVTLPAIFLAISLNLLTMGTAGLLFSVKGFGLGIALFIIPFILGGLGAGDVKLLAVVGAAKGPQFVFYAFICTALMGGFIALILLAYQRKLTSTLTRLGQGIKMLFLSRFTVWNFGSLDEEPAGSLSFPYGLAIALGSFWTYWVI